MAITLKRPGLTVTAKPGLLGKPLMRTANQGIKPATDGFGIPKANPNIVTPDGFVTGARINAENARNAEKRRATPFNFRMQVGENGVNGVRAVLLDTQRAAKQGQPYDKAKNSPFFCFMHHWGYDEKKSQHEVCIKDGPEGCPLCNRLGKEGSWEMQLTCLDARPYTPKSGPNEGKVVPISRLLYTVKTGIIPQFQRLWDQYGTYRGMVIKCFRDGPRSPSAGSQIQFERMMTETELQALATKYGNKDLIKPTDYAQAFKRASHAEMVKRYGGSGTILGAADSAEDVGTDDIPF